MSKVKNLIPSFISEQFKSNRLSGKFKAVSLFVDIVGFTPLTQGLMKHGKEGAEILSDIINEIFEPSTNLVSQFKGILANFEGDAFTAIFKNQDYLNSIQCAIEIKRLLKTYTAKTKFGNFRLNVRIGLAFGDVSWRILKTQPYHTYYFLGDAIEYSAIAQKISQPGEIIIHHSLKMKLGKLFSGKFIKRGFYKLKTFVDFKLDELSVSHYNVDPNIQSKFIPAKISEMKTHGEFRNVVPMFISFKKRKKTRIEIGKFIKEVVDQSHQYGGYFNKVDFGEKGAIILILFGAPMGIEKPITRAVEFSNQILKNYQTKLNIRFGLSYGVVYAGIIGGSSAAEYTVMGEKVNLAARITMESNWNKICYDEKISKLIEKKYESQLLKKIKLKGFRKIIQIYEFCKRRLLERDSSHVRFFGREIELKGLRRIVSRLLKKKKFEGLIYIDGPAGIGKSTLVSELRNSINTDDVFWFHLKCAEIIKSGFNPVKYFIMKYFDISIDAAEKINKENFNRLFKDFINEIKDKNLKKKLQHSKSVIASLGNIFWKDSFYEKLDAKGKYDNTIFTFKDFIRAHAGIKPVILEIEDGHWMDTDTINILKNLVINIENIPVILIITSRLNDDGSLIRLPIENVKIVSFNLKHLSENSVKNFVEDLLGDKVSKGVIQHILEKSQGNPFYIEQMILFLKESGIPTEIISRDKLEQEITKIPREINEVIVARIDRLETELKETVKTASILGQIFSIKIIKALLRNPNTLDYVKKVEDEAIWNSISEMKYIFSHALIRDSVYEMQLKKTVRRLHALAGKAIEKAYSRNLKTHYEELAYHFENAGDIEKTKEYLLKAIHYAKDNYQNRKVIKLYNQLITYLKDKKQLLECYLDLALILQMVCDWKRFIDAIKKLQKIAKSINDKTTLARSYSMHSRLLIYSGKGKEAIRLLRLAEKYILKEKNERLLSNIYGNISIYYRNIFDFNKAKEYIEKLLKIGKKLNEDKINAFGYGLLGILYGMEGYFKEALKFFKKEYQIQFKYKDKYGMAINLGNLGIIYMNLSDYQNAMKCLKKHLKVSQKLGDRFGEARVYLSLGNYYTEKGDTEKALENYNKSIEMYKELGFTDNIATVWGNIATVYMELKKYLKAEDILLKQLKFYSTKSEIEKALPVQQNIVEVYLKLGEFKKAEKYIKQLEKRLDSENKIDNAFYFAYLGELEYRRGRIKRAITNIDKALDLSKDMTMFYIFIYSLALKIEILLENRITDNVSEMLNKLETDTRKYLKKDLLKKAAILKAKLISFDDKTRGIKLLNKILKRKIDFFNQCDALYLLWELTQDRITGRKVYQLMNDFNTKKPYYLFKIRLSKMKKML